MRDATLIPAKIHQLDRAIAQAERAISEKVQSIILAGQNGLDTAEAKADAREMRRAVGNLYTQRRKAIRGICRTGDDNLSVPNRALRRQPYW